MDSDRSVFDQLTEKILVPQSGILPELFRMLVAEADAGILLNLPATIDELAGKLGRSPADLEAKLADFFRKGIVFKSNKPEGVRYRFCRDVVQFHDASIVWPEAGQDFYDLWQRYMEEEWPDYTKLVEGFIQKPLTRIIPVEQSISADAEVLTYEACRRLIQDSDRIAVTKCTCRLIAHKCARPLEVCLQIGKAADYTLERGTGRLVSREEALRIVDESEEAGLVHVTMNKSQNMHFICNCCDCCCIAMPVMVKHGRKLVDPSRFVARVDEEACTACATCAGRCFFGGIQVDAAREVAVVDPEKCMGCGICQVTCPGEAILLEPVREKDFIPVS